MRRDATTLGITLVIGLVGALSVAPPGMTYYHGGGDPAPVTDFCPTDPAYNATSALLADGTGQAAVHVDITDFDPFDPALLTIDAGTCVEWENHGTMDHTVDIVTRTSGILASEHVATLTPGSSTHHVFQDPGTYYLHCEINAFHEATMHQAIHVI